MKNIDDKLQEVLAWANEKLNSGQEPPWAWEQYNQLRKSLLGILDGRRSTISLQDSLKLQEHQGSDRPQSDCIVPLESARRRRDSLNVRLPM